MPQIVIRLNALIALLITKFNWLHANKMNVGGTIAASQIASGTIDPARLPVMAGSNTIVSSGDLVALTTEELAAIVIGTTVILSDGRSFRYSGSGNKSAEASYVFVADRTPDWTTIQNKPTTVAGYGINDAVHTTTLQNYLRVDAAQNPAFTAAQKLQGQANLNVPDKDFDPGDLAGALTTGLTF